MAKHIPPSPTSDEKRGMVGKGMQDEPDYMTHALTHEDGDAETSGAQVPPAPNDADAAIHDGIRKTLAAAIDMDVSHVEVTVTSGLVLLAGYVPERWMQHVVQTEVEKVDGVRGVDNRLHERRVKAMSRPGESQEGHKI